MTVMARDCGGVKSKPANFTPSDEELRLVCLHLDS